MSTNIEKIIEFWNIDNSYSKDDLILKMENFSVLFAYNSGKIENQNITYHDTNEIFKNGKIINYTGDIRTLYEIQNQKDCFNYLIPLISNKTPLNIETLKKVNYILCKNTIDERRYNINKERAGEFKKKYYVVGINEVGYPPEKVEEAIIDLIDEINLNLDLDPIIKASYFHVLFEHIHPFSDGNGRTGRTLLNYILMINDYPPLIIYEEDKLDYYKALEKYDIEENLDYMIKFIKYSMIKTWSKKIDHFD